MLAIIMPQVGQDLPTGLVVEWKKREGETVAAGEIVVVVESEKACFEVEADIDGVLLKIVHPEGDEVPILTPIGYLRAPGEQVPEAAA